MKPEDVIKLELLEYLNNNELDRLFLRLLGLRDPDLNSIKLILDMVRKHGHGQIVINIGKGKVNTVNETLSYLI